MRISRRKATVFAFAVFYLQSAAACYSLAESNLPNAEEPKAAKIQELEKERELTLRKVVALNEELRTNGATGAGNAAASFMAESHQAERAWLNALLTICKTDAERIDIHKQQFKLAKEQEDYLIARGKGSLVREQSVLLAKAGRLGTEIDLERAKAKAGGQPIPPNDAKDVRIKKLAQEQVESLRKVISLDDDSLNRGFVGSGAEAASQLIHQQVQNQHALMAVESALCENDKGRIAVTEKAVSIAKKQEEYFAARRLGGTIREQSVLTAKANRLGVEIDLERAKARAGGQPIPAGDARDPRIKKLAQVQVECLRKVISLDKELLDLGLVDGQSANFFVLQHFQNQHALMALELPLCDNDKERVATIEKVLAFANKTEDIFRAKAAGGIARQQSVLLVKACRLEIEIEFETLKAKAAKQK